MSHITGTDPRKAPLGPSAGLPKEDAFYSYANRLTSSKSRLAFLDHIRKFNNTNTHLAENIMELAERLAAMKGLLSKSDFSSLLRDGLGLDMRRASRLLSLAQSTPQDAENGEIDLTLRNETGLSVLARIEDSELKTMLARLAQRGNTAITVDDLKNLLAEHEAELENRVTLLSAQLEATTVAAEKSQREKDYEIGQLNLAKIRLTQELAASDTHCDRVMKKFRQLEDQYEELKIKESKVREVVREVLPEGFVSVTEAIAHQEKLLGIRRRQVMELDRKIEALKNEKVTRERQLVDLAEYASRIESLIRDWPAVKGAACEPSNDKAVTSLGRNLIVLGKLLDGEGDR